MLADNVGEPICQAPDAEAPDEAVEPLDQMPDVVAAIDEDMLTDNVERSVRRWLRPSSPSARCQRMRC